MGFGFAILAALRRSYRSAWVSPAFNSHGAADARLLRLIPPAADQQNHHSLIPRRWHVGPSHNHHHHHNDQEQRTKEAKAVFRLGFAADVALAAGKTFTGYFSGSTAIMADAAHSISDIILSGVAMWSFDAARAPKDEEHPYGHGKFETLGTLGISCMLLVTAGGIAWHAIDVLQGTLISAPDMINPAMKHDNVHAPGHGGHHHGIDLDHPALALSMTVISISVKEGLYWITKRVGDREGSGLMKANAWHHRADAVSSVVALIGVGGAILGVPYLDPLAGLLVSGMIMRAGIEAGYQSVMELVDAAVPPPVLAPIKEMIVQIEGVKGCHRLRGRKAGSSLYLDAHIEVDPLLSVSAAHDIGENVRHQIQKFHSQVAEVFIHIDPSFSYCSISKEGKEINSMEQEAETIVRDTLSSLFGEKVSIEHITRHSLQGKIFLEVKVSMPPDMLIRDAMDLAKHAEEQILKVAPNLTQVSIQLTLGHPIPQLLSGSKKA